VRRRLCSRLLLGLAPGVLAGCLDVGLAVSTTLSTLMGCSLPLAPVDCVWALLTGECVFVVTRMKKRGKGWRLIGSRVLMWLGRRVLGLPLVVVQIECLACVLVSFKSAADWSTECLAQALGAVTRWAGPPLAYCRKRTESASAGPRQRRFYTSPEAIAASVVGGMRAGGRRDGNKGRSTARRATSKDTVPPGPLLASTFSFKNRPEQGGLACSFSAFMGAAGVKTGSGAPNG
jgi:hypothetical protein